ncbi:pyridoxamine 5'-phosphate oxidase family protein [Natronorubrum thiooxidans]|uniref:Pyridoxamine 5'-phosphate oxidase n=1 Tax=Natronorubrum thiooxidans TaxID=308853 RepID=A0A1N7DJB2_9EURY|nr:pyridoxamine 5'-phosphate oxidase family protein [Natronorubrum thiooxidans]SIR75896.1 Pyridoxamine 5'-phosphate oxidase [Natronorubrum thiooxidans]
MTDSWYGQTMADEEITAFLNNQATGVLSLSNGRHAYGIPVAFAYDPDEQRAIMDLGFAEDSKKREFIEATDEVCLTVYAWHDPHDWTSVIASGPFERIDESELDDEIEAWYYRVAKDIDVSNSDIDLEWYELRADELSGVALSE